MEKITNQKVNKVGRDIAYNVLKREGKYVIKRGAYADYVCDEEKSYPIFYWTKTHQKRKINKQEFSVTGKDLDRMKVIQDLAKKQGDVFLVWVDALLGYVIGGRLSELMVAKEEGGVNFPHVEKTHKGGIMYFSIYHVPTIGEIDEADLQGLRNLIAGNRTVKGQMSLL